MIGLITLLLLVVVIGVGSTLRELRLDRPRQAPRSHAVDPDSVPPASRLVR
jgi:hypothetical protein